MLVEFTMCYLVSDNARYEAETGVHRAGKPLTAQASTNHVH